MLTSYAVGGPRDKIKLSAGIDWDGRIRMPYKDTDVIRRWYPGRYIWSIKDNLWVWSPGDPIPPAKIARLIGKVYE